MWLFLLIQPYKQILVIELSQFWLIRVHKVNYRETGGSVVEKLPADAGVQEKQVWSLGQEDPLEEEMATHSSIPGWRIPWTEEPSGLQSIGTQRVRHDWATEQSQLSK